MRKDLEVNTWLADGEVVFGEYGWDVIITIPFKTKDDAEECLNELYHLREVNDDKRRL